MEESKTVINKESPSRKAGWHKHVKRVAVVTNILAVLVLLLSATLVFLYTKYS